MIRVLVFVPYPIGCAHRPALLDRAVGALLRQEAVHAILSHGVLQLA